MPTRQPRFSGGPMPNPKYDPDERFSLNADPENVLGATLDGAGTEDADLEMEEPGTES